MAGRKTGTEMDNTRTELFTEALENVLALPGGTVLDGRYRVVRVIRQGGFGITYEAVHMQSGGKVAVKEYFCREICVRRWQGAGRPAGAECAPDAGAAYSVTVADPADRPRFEADRARFLREARILREFAQEPPVVTVLDYFEEKGTAYIVMEYLDARTLREEIMDGGTWGMEKVVRRFGPVMEVLARIHAAGVLHRDISPGNLMVLPDGTLKLIDFGAARELESGDRTHSAIYTRGYSAPEQRDEKGVLGSWTDVYGLCSLFWFCLTGRDPEDAQSRLLYDELEKPSSSGGKISPAAEELLMQGLELDSSVRIRDVETLRLALEKLYPSLTEEQKRQREARKRQWLRTAAIAGCFLLLIACCLAFIFRTRILFHFIDTQVVALNGSQMTPEEYADSSAKVRERVEALTGKGRYLWKEEEDQHIIFEVPKASFGDVDPEYYAKLMLTRPMIMRVYVELTEDSVQAEDEMSVGSGFRDETDFAEDINGSAQAFSNETDGVTARSALSSIEEKRYDGKKPGDIVTFPLDTSEKKYRYLGIFRQDKTVLDVRKASDGNVLIFRDEAAASIGSFLSGRGHHFLFCFDEFLPNGDRMTDYSFGSGYSVGDGRSVFFSKEDHIGDQSMSAPLALVKLKYGNAPSAAAFYVQCEREVRWEDPEAALLPGKNQTKADRIKAPLILLQYYPTFDLTLGEADGYTTAVLSIHAVMKNRLDSLGIPYAVGADPADQTKVFVQIPSDAGFCREELEKLGEYCANRFHLGGLRKNHFNTFYNSAFSVQEKGENSWQILMSMEKSDQDDAKEILQTLLEQDAEEVFLYDGYRPIAAGNLQEAVRSLKESGTIAFTRWTFSEYQAMDAKTLQLGRFIVTCLAQDPETDYKLVRTQTQETDGRSRFFMEGLPDPIDIDPGEKWAAGLESGNNREVTYSSSSRSLDISLYDYPLEQPEKCLAECREILGSAREKGIILSKIIIYCFEKPKDVAFRLPEPVQVCLDFGEDFGTGSMCMDYGSIRGFSKEDPEEVERAENLKAIYFQALRESPYWSRLLGEEALEKQEGIFRIAE